MNIARKTISLRPRRSATMPQIGADTAMMSAPPALIAPAQSAWLEKLAAPMSSRKKGRKGVRMLKPMIVKSWAIQRA